MDGHRLIANLPEAASILDASKLGDWMRCERQFLFEHIFGWCSEEVNLDLTFGYAAHLAKELIRTLDGYQDEAIVDVAIDKFEEAYDQVYNRDPLFEDLNKPKNKDGFISAIIEHIRKYREARKQWELLFTEVDFAVPINHDGDLYHGRMDAIYHIPGNGIT